MGRKRGGVICGYMWVIDVYQDTKYSQAGSTGGARVRHPRLMEGAAT